MARGSRSGRGSGHGSGSGSGNGDGDSAGVGVGAAVGFGAGMEMYIGTRVSFVTDGGCFACRYDLTDELRIQTDTGQLELWSQEDMAIKP